VTERSATAWASISTRSSTAGRWGGRRGT